MRPTGCRVQQQAVLMGGLSASLLSAKDAHVDCVRRFDHSVIHLALGSHVYKA